MTADQASPIFRALDEKGRGTIEGQEIVDCLAHSGIDISDSRSVRRKPHGQTQRLV